MKAGDIGKGKLQVQGKGTNLPLPAPANASQYFNANPQVTVQVTETTANHCWSATFSAASIKTNATDTFKAKN